MCHQLQRITVARCQSSVFARFLGWLGSMTRLDSKVLRSRSAGPTSSWWQPCRMEASHNVWVCVPIVLAKYQLWSWVQKQNSGQRQCTMRSWRFFYWRSVPKGMQNEYSHWKKMVSLRRSTETILWFHIDSSCLWMIIFDISRSFSTGNIVSKGNPEPKIVEHDNLVSGLEQVLFHMWGIIIPID